MIRLYCSCCSSCYLVEVDDFFHVDFEVLTLHDEIDELIAQFREEKVNYSLDETTVIVSSHHCVCFACTGLPVCEDAGVVSRKTGESHFLTDCFENIFLRFVRSDYGIVCEAFQV